MDVEAIWLRRIGDKVQVLFETGGKWHLAIEEETDGPFSHIVEQPALQSAPLCGPWADPYRRNGQEWVTARDE